MFGPLFGSWDVEKVHAVVARSTFRSQNVQNTSVSDHFWKLRCRKSARRCGAKHMSKSKYLKKITCSDHFWWFRCSFRVAGTRDYAPCQKWAKGEGFEAGPKNDGRRGTYAEDLQRYIFRGRRSTRDMFIRDVRRSGRWFPERGCILEHRIFSFGKMTLRDRCSTSHDLASLFRGRRNTLDRWSGKIAKRIGTRPSALHSTFHFWRKSRRIASFLMLSTFEKWGSFAELLRFWRCQVQKLRKSRRLAAYLIFVKFKNWGSLAQ